MLLVEGREMVHILLASGADPTAQDAQHGRTALHTASMANDVELVKVVKIAFNYMTTESKTHFLIFGHSSSVHY